MVLSRCAFHGGCSDRRLRCSHSPAAGVAGVLSSTLSGATGVCCFSVWVMNSRTGYLLNVARATFEGCHDEIVPRREQAAQSVAYLLHYPDCWTRSMVRPSSSSSQCRFLGGRNKSLLSKTDHPLPTGQISPYDWHWLPLATSKGRKPSMTDPKGISNSCTYPILFVETRPACWGARYRRMGTT